MPFDSYQAVVIAAAFLLPGYVIARIDGSAMQRQSSELWGWLHIFTLSMVNFACASWLYHVALPVWLSGFLYLLVCPAIIGVCMLANAQHMIFHRLLRKCKLQPVHPIPSAWDWKFSRYPQSFWVIVTLKSGDFVAGAFKADSFASSTVDERDIYS